MITIFTVFENREFFLLRFGRFDQLVLTLFFFKGFMVVGKGGVVQHAQKKKRLPLQLILPWTFSRLL